MDKNDFSTSLTGAEWGRLGAPGHEVRGGDAVRLESLSQSAYACSTIARLLIMSDNADTCEGDHPLNGNIVGGLHHALSVIADSMQADLGGLADRVSDKRANAIGMGEANHD